MFLAHAALRRGTNFHTCFPGTLSPAFMIGKPEDTPVMTALHESKFKVAVRTHATRAKQACHLHYNKRSPRRRRTCTGQPGEDFLKSFQGGGTGVGVQASAEGALTRPAEDTADTV